jgi:hypothetical protein
MKVRQYYPTFIEPDSAPVETEVKGIAELVALPFLADIQGFANFYRFSLRRHYHSNTHLLLAEMDEGSKWYVLAYLEGSDLTSFAGLPEWQDKK